MKKQKFSKGNLVTVKTDSALALRGKQGIVTQSDNKKGICTVIFHNADYTSPVEGVWSSDLILEEIIPAAN